MAIQISYLSTNVALLPGSEHCIASVKSVVRDYDDEPLQLCIQMIYRIGGFYEDESTKLIWIPAYAIIRIERLIQ